MGSRLSRAWYQHNTHALDVAYMCKHAGPADLVLFSGSGMVSCMQETVTGGQVSHAGIIVRGENGELYLAEMVREPSGVRDVLSGEKARAGAVLVPLRERLDQYMLEGGLAILYRRLCGVRADNDAMLAHIRETRDDTYYLSWREAARALVRKARFLSLAWWLSDDEPHEHTGFCSMHVAEIAMAGGVLETTVPATRYTPASFESDTTLALVDGAHYTPPRHLVWT